MAGSAKRASGDIRPCRFVTLSGDYEVAEANAGDYTAGVSQEGLRGPNTPDAAETLAAATGEQLTIYGPGEYCLLELAATLSAGALVKPNADGEAIAATVDAPVGAVLECGGGDGDRVRALIVNHRTDTIE